MLNKNQIKRLLTHGKKIQQDWGEPLSEKQQNRLISQWMYNKGWIKALTLVLNGDETTVNNNPINNKETVDATRSDVDQSRNTGSVR